MVGAQPIRRAFNQVRDQIGYCGIWCGGCAVGNGCLAEMGSSLREQLTAYDAHQWSSMEGGWEGFLSGLESLRQTMTCVGCREGGGRDNCEMRSCARDRLVEHCTECELFPGCRHAGPLDHMRSGAAKVGLAVLLPGEDPQVKIAEWTQQLSRRSPYCILFAKDGEAGDR